MGQKKQAEAIARTVQVVYSTQQDAQTVLDIMKAAASDAVSERAPGTIGMKPNLKITDLAIATPFSFVSVWQLGPAVLPLMTFKVSGTPTDDGMEVSLTVGQFAWGKGSFGKEPGVGGVWYIDKFNGYVKDHLPDWQWAETALPDSEPSNASPTRSPVRDKTSGGAHDNLVTCPNCGVVTPTRTGECEVCGSKFVSADDEAPEATRLGVHLRSNELICPYCKLGTGMDTGRCRRCDAPLIPEFDVSADDPKDSG